MSAPLSHRQKSYLSQLARKAWEMAEREVGTPEEFRHDEVARACGKIGLRCCSQGDYKRVEAHFLFLLGEDGQALNAHLRAETEPKRQAEAVLRRNLAECGLPWSYAEAICRQQNKGAGISEVPERRVWNLVFTVRNRGAARRKASAGQYQQTERQAA